MPLRRTPPCCLPGFPTWTPHTLRVTHVVHWCTPTRRPAWVPLCLFSLPGCVTFYLVALSRFVLDTVGCHAATTRHAYLNISFLPAPRCALPFPPYFRFGYRFTSPPRLPRHTAFSHAPARSPSRWRTVFTWRSSYAGAHTARFTTPGSGYASRFAPSLYRPTSVPSPRQNTAARHAPLPRLRAPHMRAPTTTRRCTRVLFRMRPADICWLDCRVQHGVAPHLPLRCHLRLRLLAHSGSRATLRASRSASAHLRASRTYGLYWFIDTATHTLAVTASARANALPRV